MSLIPPLRILSILEATSITGPAKAVLAFARENASQGGIADLSILTFVRNEEENAFTRAVRAAGIRLETIAETGPFDFRVIGKLKAAVARERPDVIWTNAVKSHFLVRMAGLHRRVKWVAFHHGYTSTAPRTRAYNQLDRWSLREAQRIVTVCGPFAADLKARGLDADRMRVQHMPIYPVEAQSGAGMRRELGIDDAAGVLLSVGRLSREKGFADLLEAFRRVREQRPSESLRLVIAGDGPESENLRALCGALGIERDVMFVGHQADLQPFYGMADVFVMASHSEGSPNVLLEALNAGLPVAATSVGGIPEMVADQVSALLVPPRNAEALAGAMIRLLDDERLRMRLKSAAPEVLSRHTPELYFRNLLAVFRELA